MIVLQKAQIKSLKWDGIQEGNTGVNLVSTNNNYCIINGESSSPLKKSGNWLIAIIKFAAKDKFCTIDDILKACTTASRTIELANIYTNILTEGVIYGNGFKKLLNNLMFNKLEMHLEKW